MPVHLEQLALSVARCDQVDAARQHGSDHPCQKIVSSQDAFDGPFQVPEAWAGNLESARIVFLSSNPAISAGNSQSKWRSKRFAEKYPTVDWADAEIADFMINRFNPEHGWVKDEKHLKVDSASPDGQPMWGSPEPYWKWVKKQTTSLLGDGTVWNDAAVMTEVVHCKSNGEEGVSEATLRCSTKHMERILSATSAGLVVIVGSKAANAFKAAHAVALKDKPEFGKAGAIGLPDARHNVFQLEIGGHSRLVVFIKHPNARGQVTTLENQYPEAIEEIQAAARGLH